MLNIDAGAGGLRVGGLRENEQIHTLLKCERGRIMETEAAVVLGLRGKACPCSECASLPLPSPGPQVSDKPSPRLWSWWTTAASSQRDCGASVGFANSHHPFVVVVNLKPHTMLLSVLRDYTWWSFSSRPSSPFPPQPLPYSLSNGKATHKQVLLKLPAPAGHR